MSRWTNYTFAGNITTYVSSSLGLYGTTTIEPNTVIKFAESSSVKMTVNGPVICLPGPFRPAVLTSVNDDDPGEPIPGSTGTPANTTGATYLSDANTTTNSYQYLRFAYAGVGFEMSAEVSGLWHSQFLKCATGIKSTGGHAVNLFNVLLAKCATGLDVSSANAYGQHVTLDQSSTAIVNATAGYFTNSIVTASTGTNLLQLYSSLLTSSTSGIYQQVGGGSYYLIAGNASYNAGSTNINAKLKADLAELTVVPPIVYSNAVINTVTTLSPQATRDADTPDLGYHYPPLDYVFGGTDAYTNITFTAGTAVGWFRTTSGFFHAGHGLHMDDRQIVSFNGKAKAPCYWVRCNVVQEGGTGIWLRGNGPGGITGWADQNAHDVTRSPEIWAKFTKFSVLAYDENHFRDDNGYLIVRATHSEFLSGGAGGYILSLYLTNCLMDRIAVAQNTGWTNTAFAFRNVTFHGGDLSYNRTASPMPVTIRDSSFDGTTFSVADAYNANPAVTDYAYNAFLTTGPFSTPTNSHDVRITNFNWQVSVLGNYYLPTNSALISVGSRNATNAFLYHFTTLTNQVKETNTVVDIGYHYVAVAGSGVPLDFDGDGLPDYFEDANGNGSFDPSETNWKVYNSQFGLSTNLFGPIVFNPLK